MKHGKIFVFLVGCIALSIFLPYNVYSSDDTIREEVEGILLRGVSLDDPPDLKLNMLKKLGPQVPEILINIVKDNYTAELRSIEHTLANAAIAYLGELDYKKALPLLKDIAQNYLIDGKKSHIRKGAIQTIIRMDAKGHKKLIEDILNPQKTPDDLLRYSVVEHLAKYSPDITPGLLRKIMKQEKDHGVILKIDQILAETDPTYKDSDERWQYLEEGLSCFPHPNYKKKYEKRLKAKRKKK